MGTRWIIFVLAFMLLVCAPEARVFSNSGNQSPTGGPSSQTASGSYRGTATSKSQGDIAIEMQIISDNGKLKGRISTPLGEFAITGSIHSGSRIELKFDINGVEGKIAGEYLGGRIVGEWSLGQEGGAIELNRADSSGSGPASTSSRTQPPSATPKLTKAQWREDLQHLSKELPKKHKNLFHTMTKEQFERAVAELDSAIPSLADHEIVIGLIRILAMVGDSHTNAVEGWLVFRRYPIALYWFGDDLRVTRATSEYSKLLGARVLRIGDKGLEEARAAVNSLIPQGETKGFAQLWSAGILALAEPLHALKLVPDTERAQFTFESEDGKQFTIALPAIPNTANIEWVRAAKSEPLYRQRQKEPLWFTYLEEAHTVYVSFSGYPEGSEFKRICYELFAFIDRHRAKRLVIDMRRNAGGDFTKAREMLIPGLKRRADINKPGGLFVVIGRGTLSAAMSNAADFRKETRAILVGEPTGARPNGYQENDEFRLPNSRLKISYSTRYYKFQDEDTPGVMPDKLIEMTWPDFREGRDPVLEWIISNPSDKKL